MSRRDGGRPTWLSVGSPRVARRVTSRGAALLIIGLLAASCASAPPPSGPTTQADQAVASQVSAALNADPLYFYRHVNVRVDGGVAYLSGYVASADAIYHAREVALKVPGITKVVTNHLQLDRNGPPR